MAVRIAPNMVGSRVAHAQISSPISSVGCGHSCAFAPSAGTTRRMAGLVGSSAQRSALVRQMT
jgi:hypothetical protein